MKAALLSVVLLFAPSSELFALGVNEHPARSAWDLFGDPVLATKKLVVTVVGAPSPTHLVVHVDGRGDLLLTAYEAIQKRDNLPWLGLEICVVRHKNGQEAVHFTIVPVGRHDKWRIPIKSANPCETLSM